jgi:hypothetical protein
MLFACRFFYAQKQGGAELTPIVVLLLGLPLPALLTFIVVLACLVLVLLILIAFVPNMIEKLTALIRALTALIKVLRGRNIKDE